MRMRICVHVLLLPPAFLSSCCKHMRHEKLAMQLVFANGVLETASLILSNSDKFCVNKQGFGTALIALLTLMCVDDPVARIVSRIFSNATSLTPLGRLRFDFKAMSWCPILLV